MADKSVLSTTEEIDRLRLTNAEMLEALEATSQALCPPGHTEKTVGSNFGERMQTCFRQIKDAIRKAKGEL